MSAEDPADAISMRNHADQLAAVPYLLGYHPRTSVVIVTDNASCGLFVACGPIPDDPHTPPADLQKLAQYIAAVTARQHAGTATLIGYGTAAHADPMLCALREAFAAADITASIVLRVADGHYYCYQCDDGCPPQATAFDPTSTVAAATATLAGYVALPDRTAFAAQLAPIDGPQRDAMKVSTRRAAHRLGHLIDTVTGKPGWVPPAGQQQDTATSRVVAQVIATIVTAARTALTDAIGEYEHGRRLTDNAAAWLSMLLSYAPVRQYAWDYLGDTDAHLRVWIDLTRRAHPDLVAYPAALLAVLAWKRGDGTLANIAVERALRADPENATAVLMRDILTAGVDPSLLDQR